MPFPYSYKKSPRSSALTVRLSKEAVVQLKCIASEENLSQADVVECLLEEEFRKRKLEKPTLEVVQTTTEQPWSP